ncbi:unnamed protein product [marine sediment metagenome]|uniref:Uncharacterized protein n=1 Tax=marine sediment metagenome TaxID=412755 RepID=X0YRN0_9ZZZZ
MVKIEIDIPRRILRKVVFHLKECWDYKTTVEELRTNPEFVRWLKMDAESMWLDQFDDNLADALEQLKVSKIKGKHIHRED